LAVIKRNIIINKYTAMRILLFALCLSLFAWYIKHPALTSTTDDLTRPSFFWPGLDGKKPGPGNPMMPVGIILDKDLAENSNNREALLQALDQWNSITGSSARIIYLGEWDFEDYSSMYDGFNGIELIKEDWAFPSQFLADTEIIMYNTNTGKILEVDIYFNGVIWKNPDTGRKWQWKFGDLLNDHGFQPDYQNVHIRKADFRSIITHELGHFLGLGHSQVEAATMYNSLHAQDEIKHRTLSKDDRRGIRWLYPETKASLPGPSLWRLEEADCGWTWTYDWSAETANQSDGVSLFCLYAAGLRGSQFQVWFVDDAGTEFSPVSSLELLSENLLRFDLDLSQLSPGIYDLELELQDGKVGSKKAALEVQ